MKALPMLYVLPLDSPNTGTVCMVCKAQAFPAVAAFIKPGSPGSEELIETVLALDPGNDQLLRWVVLRDHADLVTIDGDVRSQPSELATGKIGKALAREDRRYILATLTAGGLPEGLPISKDTDNFALIYQHRQIVEILEDPFTPRFASMNALAETVPLKAMQAAVDSMTGRAAAGVA